jgi:hypothetical protein
MPGSGSGLKSAAGTPAGILTRAALHIGAERRLAGSFPACCSPRGQYGRIYGRI